MTDPDIDLKTRTAIETALKGETTQKIVKKEVRRQRNKVAIWFGAANVIAILGIWFTVQNAAVNASVEQGKKDTDRYLQIYSEQFKTYGNLIQSLSSKYTDQANDYAKLQVARTQLESSINDFQTAIPNLQRQLKSSQTDIASLQAETAQLSGTLHGITQADTFRFAAAAKALLTEFPDSLPRLEDILIRLGRVYNYGLIYLPENIYYVTGDKAKEFEAADYPEVAKYSYSLEGRLPDGAEIVNAWVVPWQQLNDISKFYQFSVEQDTASPSKLVLRVAGLKQQARLALRIYVFYRVKAG